MKLSILRCLVLIFISTTHFLAQTKPEATPTASPTPPTDILQTSLQAKTISAAGIPPQAQTQLAAATKLMLEGNFEASIAANTSIISRYPKIMIAYNNRGYCYMQLDKIEEAITDFNAALKISPSSLTYNNRGMTFLKKGDYTNALADLSKAIQMNPQDSLGYNNRAIAYTRLEKFDLALADQNKAIALSPKESMFLANRCFSYIKLQKIEQAIEDCTNSIRINPKRAIAYANRGTAYMQISSFESALADYKIAVQLDNTVADFHTLLGYLQTNSGQLEEAIQSLTNSIKIKPMTVSYLYRAAAYSKLSQPELELNDYNRAIELEPNNGLIYNNRATYFVRIGKIDASLADYSKAIELNPKVATFYRNRAYIFNQIGEKEKAAADEKAADLIENAGNQ